jgi:hypothetical protein
MRRCTSKPTAWTNPDCSGPSRFPPAQLEILEGDLVSGAELGVVLENVGQAPVASVVSRIRTSWR